MRWPVVAAGLAVLVAGASGRSLDWKLQCAAPAKGDAVIAYSPLYGHPNLTDSAWNDQTPAFLEYGPITALEVYRSERWHDPYIGWHEGGEFKGVRPTYGSTTNNDELLFGARKPHKPANITLEAGEKIVKVELQYDEVMRWMAFTTNTGRRLEWGFKDFTPQTVTEVVDAPREGAYLAAIRGFEGRPLPKELGGYKKRYIIQIGLVWAMPECGGGYVWEEPGGGGGWLGGLFGGLFGGGRRQGARAPAPAFAPVPRLSVTPPPPLPPSPPPPAPLPAAGGEGVLVGADGAPLPPAVAEAVAAGQPQPVPAAAPSPAPVAAAAASRLPERGPRVAPAPAARTFGR